MIGVDLQRALDAFPIEAWVREHGFESVARDERGATCPRCGKDQKLVVNVRKRRWQCWVCRRQEERLDAVGRRRRVTVEGGGGLLRLFAWWYGVSVGEAARWVLRVSQPVPLALADLPELDLVAHLTSEEEGDHAADLVPPHPPEGAVPLTEDNLSYLRWRGITAEVAHAYGLFSCVGGRYDRRVVFPAWGPAGELLYWQTRATWPREEDAALGRDHIKMLNPRRAREGEPPTLTSEHTVFNLTRAAQIGGGRIALVEGPIDAIQAGDDAVALWGKRLYPAQLRCLLAAGVRDVEIMLDGPSPSEPEGARQETEELSRMLGLFFHRVFVVRLPAGDPGGYSRRDNAHFRSQAVEVSGAPRILTI